MVHMGPGKDLGIGHPGKPHHLDIQCLSGTHSQLQKASYLITEVRMGKKRVAHLVGIVCMDLRSCHLDICMSAYDFGRCR